MSTEVTVHLSLPNYNESLLSPASTEPEKSEVMMTSLNIKINGILGYSPLYYVPAELIINQPLNHCHAP